MSRAYRIRVSETLERVIHVEDGVATQLELLPILPKERMQEILAQELAAAGLSVEDGVAKRVTKTKEGEITLAVDVATGEVSVRVTREQDVSLKTTRERVVAEERRAGVEDSLRQEAQKVLEQEADRAAEEARKAATARLEAELRDARGELDRVVHRVTAQALKEKAATMGDIEEVSEDEEAGVLTIRVRV